MAVSTWTEVEARWMSFEASGRRDAIEHEARALLATASSAELRIRLISAANLASEAVRSGDQGTAAQFLAAADELRAAVRRTRPEPGDPALMASLEAALGLYLTDERRYTAAQQAYGTALGLLRPGIDSLKRSAVLTNSSVTALYQEDFARAQELLSRAEAELELSLAPTRLKQLRRSIVHINQASGLLQSGQSSEGQRCLLEALSLLRDSPHHHLLGRVYYNLSITYATARQFGSACDAAAQSVESYAASDSPEDVKWASAALANALSNLGRDAEARELLAPIVEPWLDGSTPLPRWANDALSTLKLLVDRDRSDPGDPRLDATIEQLRSEDHTLSMLVSDALDSISDAAIRRLSGLEPDAQLPDMTWTLTRLDSVPHLQAPAAAKFIRWIMDAVGTGTVPPRDEVEAAAAFVSMDSDEILTYLRIFAVNGPLTPQHILEMSLTSIYFTQRRTRHEDQEAHRARLLVGRAANDLDDAFESATNDPSTMAELIEFMRTDHASLSSPQLSAAALESFRVLTGATDPDDVEALGDPPIVSVRGSSAIGRTVGLPATHDLSDVLRAWSGDRPGAWWSMRILGGSIYWSVLTESGDHAGRIPIARRLTDALRAHELGLVVQLSEDGEVLLPRPEQWEVQCVAIARAAMQPLLGDEALMEQAVACLPPAIGVQVRDYARQQARRSGLHIYNTIADELLPEPLVEFVRNHPDSTLLVTLPPELSTVPLGLLPIGVFGECLADRTAVTLVPPIGIASGCGLGSPPGDLPLAVTIANPSGDLSSSRRSEGAVYLTGWGGAASIDDVATIDRSRDVLRGAPTSSVFSYVGHIQPGRSDRPGMAALVLAPPQIGHAPDIVGVSQLMRGGWTFPSEVYLGGCEGSGFGTGLEWASVAATMLINGADRVLAHGWPIVDTQSAGEVDSACVELLCKAGDPAETLRQQQITWLEQWRRDPAASPAPHYWAGLHFVGPPRTRR